MYVITNKNYLYILLLIFLISNFGTFFQSQFIYDGFHWGLVAQSALDLGKDNLLPYKDFFIHYGFLSTLTQSIILKLFSEDTFFLLFASSIFFTIGNFLLCLIAKKYLDNFSVIIICLIIFLIHPFANHPWYNYQFYFLLVLALFFISSKSNLGIFLFGFFLSLATLVYENFFYLSLLILFFYIYLNFLNKKKYFFLSCIFGFILPLIFFQLYLFYFSLHEYWIKTFTLNKAFFEIYQMNFTELLVNYFRTLISKNFFTQSYFYIFILIFFLNLYISVSFFIKKIKKKFLSEEENNIFLFSFLSLILFSTTIHNPTIFRFSTGPAIGFVSIFYFLNKLNIQKLKMVYFLIILQLFSNTALPIKTENNKFFPKFSDIEQNISNAEIRYFESQKWNKNTWETITFFNNETKSIKKHCKNITEFLNYTDDAFIYMIANQYFNSSQYLYWLTSKNYYQILLNHYEKDVLKKISKKIYNKKLIIFIDRKNLFFFKKKYNLTDYSFIDAPYSYDLKSKGILIPNMCLTKYQLLK
jgi:hypothetical protein